MTLLKQRRAFAAFVMSTTTVMDKGIKSLFRVKYPTKKTAHAALLNLLVARETWLSESPTVSRTQI
jgi:hypothetical protein